MKKFLNYAGKNFLRNGLFLAVVALLLMIFSSRNAITYPNMFIAGVVFIAIGVALYELTDNKLKEAQSLEKAIEIAFKTLKPGEKFIGPKQKVVLLRNTIPMDMENGSVEIYVLSLDRTDDNRIITAFWDKEDGIRFVTENHRHISYWEDAW